MMLSANQEAQVSFMVFDGFHQLGDGNALPVHPHLQA